MKKIPTTLIFFIATVLLLIVTVIVHKTSEKKEETEKVASQLLGELNNKAIKEIVFHFGEFPLHLNKQEGVWKLLKPFEDLAEEAAVDTFLDDLKTTGVEVIFDSSQEKTQGSQFDFSKPSGFLEIVGEDKTNSYTIEVSSQRAFDGSIYLKKKGGSIAEPADQNIYMSSEFTMDLFQKKVKDFQSRKMFVSGTDWDEEGIAKISFNTKDNKKLSFLKEDQIWKQSQSMGKKPDQKLDQEVIKKYVSTLYFLRADAVVESKKSPSLLEKYKLNKPQWTWNVDHVKGQWSLSMSKQERGKGESFYLLSSSSRGIYRLDRDIIENLHKNEDDFFEKESSSDETSSEESSSQEAS